MKIAALYDIHGNLPALNATLADVRSASVDLIVIGGDVLPGPMPVECLDRLATLDIPALFLSGNGEREIIATRAGTPPNVPERYRPMMEWVANQLSADHAKWIASWPATVSLHVPSIGELFFCHATPGSDSQLFTASSSDTLIERLFGSTNADVAICGHTHMQFRRRHRTGEIVNAGSIGMSYGAGGAEWLLIEEWIEFRRTQYDRPSAAERVRSTAYPLADEFAETSILSPPSTEVMLAAYTRAAE